MNNYKVQIAVGPPRQENETLAEYLKRNLRDKHTRSCDKSDWDSLDYRDRRREEIAYNHAERLAEALEDLMRQIERDNLHTTIGIKLARSRDALAQWERKEGKDNEQLQKALTELAQWEVVK